MEQFYGTILCSVILFYDSVIQNESGGFLGATGLSAGVFDLSGLNSCSIYWGRQTEKDWATAAPLPVP